MIPPNEAARALALRGAERAAIRLAERAATMTPEERSELARMAARCRWSVKQPPLQALAHLLRVLLSTSTSTSTNKVLIQRTKEVAEMLEGGKP